MLYGRRAMWEPGKALCVVEGFTPLPAQREGGDRAAQARLAEYLTRLTGRVLPLPTSPLPLYLHLHVQVPREANVLHGFVLENFLSPLFGVRWLGGAQFSLVIGTKGTGSPSRLAIGLASTASASSKEAAGCKATPMEAPGSQEWIEQLRRALSRAGSVPLPEGPVHLRVQLRCSPDRDWVALWKPAGDAMGPILGYDHLRNPYRPRDDRLTRLEFHRQTDGRLGNTIEVEYGWTAVPVEES
jgi:hypothetical protein